ncbi:MAG: hypothetical protein ACYS5V_14780 [Planctomycetota bacterium]
MAMGILAALLAGCEAGGIFGPGEKPAKISEAAVQQLVLSLADEHVMLVSGPILTWRHKATTPEERLAYHSLLRVLRMSTYDVAMNPDPMMGLLDLLVLSTLQRAATERVLAGGGRLRAEAHPLLDHVRTKLPALAEKLRASEKVLWAESKMVLTDKQTGYLRRLIKEWLRKHPQRTFVSLVRFRQFRDPTLMPPPEAKLALGLVTELGEMTEAVDAARLFGERVTWLTARMSTLVGQQAEYTVYRLAVQPEAKDALKGFENASKSMQRMATVAEELPGNVTRQRIEWMQQVSRERQAAIDQLMAGVGEQRKAMMDDLEARQQAVQGLLGDLQTTLKTGSELAGSVTEALRAADVLAKRFDKPCPATRPAGEPFDIKDVRDTAVETAKAADELKQLLAEANRLLANKAWDKRLSEVDTHAEHLISTTFYRVLMIVGLLFVLMLAYRIATRAIPARPHKETPTEPSASGMDD